MLFMFHITLTYDAINTDYHIHFVIMNSPYNALYYEMHAFYISLSINENNSLAALESGLFSL